MNRGSNKIGELSYFSAALRAFLRESHPHICEDAEFILSRSDAALETFIRVRQSGASIFAALESANAVLYADLRFSKYDTLYDIVAEWFPEVPPVRRGPFCVSLLTECQELFELYDLSDDFQTRSEFNSLQIELTGFIQEKIENDGIQ